MEKFSNQNHFPKGNAVIYRFSTVSKRKLLALIIVFLLVGCGSNSNTISSGNTSLSSTPINSTNTSSTTPDQVPGPTDTPVPTSTPVPTATPTDTPVPISIPTQDASALSVTQGGSINLFPLNIVAESFHCIVDIYQPYQDEDLVLAGGSSSYNVGQISQVANAMNTKNISSLPEGFAAVQGALAQNGKGGCFTTWQITNTSQSTVQISQIGLRYTAASQSNNYQYNLIDICTIPGYNGASLDCTSGRGGNASPYVYTFNVGEGNTGTTITGNEVEGSVPVLNPGDTISVDLNVDLDASANPNSVFSIMPLLALDMPGQQGVLPVQQMTSTIAFFDTSHASCYQLQSDYTFTKLDSSDIPNTSDYKVECK